MTKKRTRKQKVEAHHRFSIEWQPALSSSKNNIASSNVNTQMKDDKNVKKSDQSSNDTAVLSDKSYSLASIKKEVIKSLILAALILASEIVIYLNWTKILSLRLGF